jgi:prophage regulatory protein
MRLIPYEGLEAKGIPHSKPQLWRLVKEGEFPKPVRIGGCRNAWVESEIDAYIAERIAERDQGARPRKPNPHPLGSKRKSPDDAQAQAE